MLGKYALIKDGVVVNIILADDTYAPPEGYSLVPSDTIAQIGGLWDGEKFWPKAIEEAPVELSDLEKKVLELEQVIDAMLGGGPVE